MQDAVDLLHPLLTDTVDFVKQGALIATALVLMQQPESKVGTCIYAWLETSTCAHCVCVRTLCSVASKPKLCHCESDPDAAIAAKALTEGCILALPL